MIIPILIAILAIVILLVLIVALQPAAFRVERSTSIAEPATTVFANVNDLHRWQAWSPWENVDANLQRTYQGAPNGTGAIYEWVGKKTGSGRMTIIESRPGQLVKIKLEFFKPFRATNTAEFTFLPDGGQSTVTWAMYGDKNLMAKAMHLFVSMDTIVGGMFEKGLLQLKTVSEGQGK